MIIEHRDPGAALRRIAIPDAVTLAADQLLGIADTIVIGALGTDALAAISGASVVFAVVAIAQFGFNSGPRILGAQAIGSASNDRFGAIVRAGVVVPLLLSLVVVVLALAFAQPLMRGVIGPLPTVPVAAHYLVLRCLAMIPMTMSGAAVVAFATTGNTQFGLRLLVLINLLHLPLLVVLALGAGAFHGFGLVGAGYSTLIAETIACVFALWTLARHREMRVFARRHVDVALVAATFWISLPDYVFLLLMLAPDAAIVAFLAPLGAQTIAAFRAFSIVTDLSWALPGSLGDAMQTIIGQRLGARDDDGAQQFFDRARRIAVRANVVAAVVLAIVAWPLAALFTLNPALATLAALPLALHMFTLPLKGFAMATIAPIRASGDTRFSMIVGASTSVIVIPLAWFLIAHAHLGLYAVGVAWILAWLVRSFLTQARLRTGDWLARERLTA